MYLLSFSRGIFHRKRDMLFSEGSLRSFSGRFISVSLIRCFAGRKIFRLFSPRVAGLLPTKGRIVSVHPNGLICYSEHIREDGAHLHNVRRWKQTVLEEKIAHLEERLAAVKEKRKKKKKRNSGNVQEERGRETNNDSAEEEEDLQSQLNEAETEYVCLSLLSKETCRCLRIHSLLSLWT